MEKVDGKTLAERCSYSKRQGGTNFESEGSENVRADWGLFLLLGPALRPIRLRAALKTLKQKTGPYKKSISINQIFQR